VAAIDGLGASGESAVKIRKARRAKCVMDFAKINIFFD